MKPLHTRFSWRHIKSKLLSCQRKGRTPERKSPSPSLVVLDEPVLEEILKKLDLNARVQLRNLSPAVSHLVDRMPLTLPFVFFRSNGCGDIELHCDRMDVLLAYVLPDQCAFEARDGAIVFSYNNAHTVITSLVSRITGIAHLWLDSEWNGLIIQAIVEYYQSINTGNMRMRLYMEELTVVGGIRSSDIDWISSLILLSRRSLKHLRFRHCRLHSQPQTVQFWSAISQCQQLRALQYEPCRLDKWSRPHLIDSLDNKALKSLILTGIDGLQPADLIRIAAGSQLVELAVVGELIKPSIYAQNEAIKMLGTIKNLLIQVDSTFSIDDTTERAAMLRVMAALPSDGILEVIHVSRGTVSDTTKLISYWIRLARDSSCEVKLKLEECSQERADAAVGRLLRKARDVTRSVWTRCGVRLEMDAGRLTVLDKRSWFDEHEHER
ncbi:F-box domain protein [Trichostrongylus colubriformis]|uniref:F-box domain protein n=1 Tax=Trichostrongylus colubriformis TaxID=6319 RepID=A0AAN8F826_TRICO